MRDTGKERQQKLAKKNAWKKSVEVEKNDDEQFISKEMSAKIMKTAHIQNVEENMGGAVETYSTEEVEVSDLMDFNISEEVEEDYDGTTFASEMDIDENDEAALNLFMNLTNRPSTKVNLADLIMEKMREAEEGPGPELAKMNPKILQVYASVAKVLRRYKSGKLPKPFKIIPALSNWEEVS